jgi:hypothetical protein
VFWAWADAKNRSVSKRAEQRFLADIFKREGLLGLVRGLNHIGRGRGIHDVTSRSEHGAGLALTMQT